MGAMSHEEFLFLITAGYKVWYNLVFSFYLQVDFGFCSVLVFFFSIHEMLVC